MHLVGGGAAAMVPFIREMCCGLPVMLTSWPDGRQPKYSLEVHLRFPPCLLDGAHCSLARAYGPTDFTRLQNLQRFFHTLKKTPNTPPITGTVDGCVRKHTPPEPTAKWP